MTPAETGGRDFAGHTLPPEKLEILTPELETLIPTQTEGVNWLGLLATYQLHGILCDDMGLGKTIQVLLKVNLKKSTC